MKIAYYISNHGFGHATRAVALIEILIRAGIECHIITDRPFYLFKDLNPLYAFYHQKATDFGFVQKTILEIDQEATLKKLELFNENKHDLISAEIKFCQNLQIDLILSDIVPIAFLVAKKLDIPVYAISNFEWYSLYHHIFKDINQKLYSWILEAYNLADKTFILPFNGENGMSLLPHSEPVGLLARKGTNIKKKLREQHNIPSTHLYVLCAFQEEISFNYHSLLNCKNISVFGHIDIDHPNYYKIDNKRSFTDYIASSDVIIAKTGYSTIAEAVQYQKRLLLLIRNGNYEDQLLTKGLEKYNNYDLIPFGDQNNIDWQKKIFSFPSNKGLIYKNSNLEIAKRIIQVFYTTKQSKKIVIDVGTNNIQMIWASQENSTNIVHQRSSFVSSLAKGMKDGLLLQSGLKRAKKLLSNLLDLSIAFSDDIMITGSSCSREAKNSNEITSFIKKKYHICYHILSEHQEAFLNGKANIIDFKNMKHLITFDIGGGSTEFTEIHHNKITYTKSLPIGIRRYQNNFGNSIETKKHETITQLQNLKQFYPKDFSLIGIGGVPSNLSAVLQGLTRFNHSKTHQTILTKSQLQKLIDYFYKKSFNEIKQIMPFEPQKSQIILTGIMIIIEILIFFEVDKIHVSDNGLMIGLLNLNDEEMRDLRLK